LICPVIMYTIIDPMLHAYSKIPGLPSDQIKDECNGWAGSSYWFMEYISIMKLIYLDCTIITLVRSDQDLI